jgi:hypothetical protein
MSSAARTDELVLNPPSLCPVAWVCPLRSSVMLAMSHSGANGSVYVVGVIGRCGRPPSRPRERLNR